MKLLQSPDDIISTRVDGKLGIWVRRKELNMYLLIESQMRSRFIIAYGYSEGVALLTAVKNRNMGRLAEVNFMKR